MTSLLLMFFLAPPTYLRPGFMTVFFYLLFIVMEAKIAAMGDSGKLRDTDGISGLMESFSFPWYR